MPTSSSSAVAEVGKPSTERSSDVVIRASDELRHPHSDHRLWRESMWFCFQDPAQQLGSAIYYSCRPNLDPPAASFSVYVVRGMAELPNAPLYHLQLDVAIPDGDWDDLHVRDAAHYRRIDPLRRWEISIRDGERFNADLEATFYAGAWHYADNVHATPKYLAADRYHRPFRAVGEMELDGERITIDTTGDSDHSWGERRWRPLFKSKYIAGQCGTDFAFQIMSALSAEGGVVPYGFVWDGTTMSPITDLEITPSYSRSDGVQEGVVMNIVDDGSRLTRVSGTTFCSYPGDFGEVWNNDCYATFDVNDGAFEGSGILSFYWGRDHYRRVFGR